MKTLSTVHSSIAAASVGMLNLANEDVTPQCISDLRSMGICFDNQDIIAMQSLLENGMQPGFAMDTDLTVPLTTGSVTTPVQFAQAWLPGVVRIVTAPRNIDNLIGIMTQGDWADEEIVQSLLGNSGKAQAYTDNGNIPLANWNQNFVTRTIVRLELGLEVGRLEQERGSKVRISSADEKRYGVIEGLEIGRNDIGFFGYNDGDNKTYGLLNDPQLLAYETLPSGGDWPNEAYLDIINDLIFMAATLQNQSYGRVNVRTDAICFAIPVITDQYLNKTSEYGKSVREWIRETYPNWRIEIVPQFEAANGGQNVGYLYAESVGNSGTDDSRTFVQVVPTKFRSLGIEQRAKGYAEDYSNATAGSLCKRPYAVTRYTNL